MDVWTAEWDDIWAAWRTLTEEEQAQVRERIRVETLTVVKAYAEAMEQATKTIQKFGAAYAAAVRET